jgi:hypothetical protein
MQVVMLTARHSMRSHHWLRHWSREEQILLDAYLNENLSIPLGTGVEVPVGSCSQNPRGGLPD